MTIPQIQSRDKLEPASGGLIGAKATIGRWENATGYLQMNGTTVAGRREALAERDSAAQDLPQALRLTLGVADDLLAAVKGFLDDIDRGFLVRDITHDHESGWSLQMLAFVQRLQDAQRAVAKAEGSL